MNKIDFIVPGKTENKILEILSERDHLDYMSLRSFFPLEVPSIEKKCNDLIFLGLIKKEKIDKEIQYVLTDEGAKSLTRGLDKWIKHKVLNDIKNDLYIITKSTPSVERFAVRNLESEGKIFLDGNVYKVVPGENIETSIELPSGNPNNIIDKMISDIYTLQIPFDQMQIEKTHRHDVRHVMNYLEENKIVEIGSDPVKLTPLGLHIYHVGFDKWKREKDREELLGEKIKNSHPQSQLGSKDNKSWNNKISDWYTHHEKVINLTVAVVSICGFILALVQLT